MYPLSANGSWLRGLFEGNTLETPGLDARGGDEEGTGRICQSVAASEALEAGWARRFVELGWRLGAAAAVGHFAHRATGAQLGEPWEYLARE